MVFHEDNEIEFEIYRTREGIIQPQLLGHMVGITADDAKTRWVEARHTGPPGYDLSPEEEALIIAVVPVNL